jgi:peptidyl-prolyl cis-trans isomerase-like protein 2
MLLKGLDVLKKMESIPTNHQDKPQADIKILETIVYQDPFEDYTTKLQKKEQREKQLAEKEKDSAVDAHERWFHSKSSTPVKEVGVGKYLAEGKSTKTTREEVKAVALPPPKKKKVVGKSGFGDFSSW